MSTRVEEALRQADETRALRVGADILDQAADLFREQFPGKRALVVADTNTWRVAGERVHQILTEAGIEQESPFVFPAEGLHAEFTYVEQLDANLAQHDAIPIAVGSGTINDLCKLCSFRNGRRYMVCGTAASMDGYTSFGASITYQGAKQTFSCPAPLAALVDTRIAAAAPSDMTASGYADLFAKIPAGADWILADALGVEPIKPNIWGIVQDGLHDALADPAGARSGKVETLAPLVEGLILGGFAMQASKSSRPASGADHQFSHLWDMEHHTHNGVAPSHGFKVAIGSLASIAMYECMLNTDMTTLDVEACVAAWPSLEDACAVAAKMFEGSDFPMLGVTEITAKYCDKDELRRQLTVLKMDWETIKARLRKQLVPFHETQRRFALVGAPTKPEDIGISKDRLRASFIRAQHIRRRFTILDVAVRSCFFETWLNQIFGDGGFWN